MKVTISQDIRKAGLLGGKKEWATTMTIVATEEEKAIISECNIGGIGVAELPSIGNTSERSYTADDLISQQVFVASSDKWNANIVARKMKTAAANLKTLMEEAVADETGEIEL